MNLIEGPFRRWEAAFFRTAHHGYLWGSIWGRWGIRHARGRYAVYLLGGKRLTEFDRLSCARRFCETVEGLTDWSRPEAELAANDELALTVHRAALRVTGGHPQLKSS